MTAFKKQILEILVHEDCRYSPEKIATRLGFQSVHYFSRRFRQITGMSPSEYAQSVKMLSEPPGISADDCAKNV